MPPAPMDSDAVVPGMAPSTIHEEVEDMEGQVSGNNQACTPSSSRNRGREFQSTPARSVHSVLQHGRTTNMRTQSIVTGTLDDDKAHTVAPEVATMMEIRASLKRYSMRHSCAAKHFRTRFHVLAAGSLVTTCMGPLIEVFESHLGSELGIKLFKAFVSAIAIMMVGLQNMMGYQTKADLHTSAADEFDNLRAAFDYEVWYPCASLNMALPDDIETAKTALQNFLTKKTEKIEDVQQKTPALPLQFCRIELTEHDDQTLFSSGRAPVLLRAATPANNLLKSS